MAITFKIIKQLGILSDKQNGFKKEINVVSWNDRDPKIDIRDWNEAHDRMKKGITLNKEEFEALKKIAGSIDSDSLEIE